MILVKKFALEKNCSVVYFFSEIKYKPAYHQICKERDMYYQSLTENIFDELIKKKK